MELFITKLYGLNFLVLQIHFKMVDETIFGHLSHCIVLVPSLLFKPEFLFNKKLFDSIQTFRYQWCIVIYLFLKVWTESNEFLLNKKFQNGWWDNFWTSVPLCSSHPYFSNKNKKELLANEQPEAEAAAAAPTDDASTHAEKLFQTCWNIGEGTDVDL